MRLSLGIFTLPLLTWVVITWSYLKLVHSFPGQCFSTSQKTGTSLCRLSAIVPDTPDTLVEKPVIQIQKQNLDKFVPENLRSFYLHHIFRPAQDIIRRDSISADEWPIVQQVIPSARTIYQPCLEAAWHLAPHNHSYQFFADTLWTVAFTPVDVAKVLKTCQANLDIFSNIQCAYAKGPPEWPLPITKMCEYIRKVRSVDIRSQLTTPFRRRSRGYPLLEILHNYVLTEIDRWMSHHPPEKTESELESVETRTSFRGIDLLELTEQQSFNFNAIQQLSGSRQQSTPRMCSWDTER